MHRGSTNWWLISILAMLCAVCASWEASGAQPDSEPFPTGQPMPWESALWSGEPDQSRQQAKPLQRVRVSQFQMGMLVDLTLWAPTRKSGQEAAGLAFQRVRALNQIFSDYEPASELSRLCRQAGQGPVTVSTELFEVLTAARQLAEWTGGLYDPTLGPVVRQWREARRTGKEPADLEAARRLVGYQKMRLDATLQTVELAQPGMLVDLGSIAKGYVGDEVLRILAGQGIRRAAFEAGGDKVLGDPPPGESGWPIDIGKRAHTGKVPNTEAPPKPLRLANCAVSVSGDTVQYFERNGQRTSHVIDPRIGRGTSSRRMCVVIGPRGALTDPLATIGTLMPRDDYESLLRQHFPQVRSLIFRATDQNDLAPPRIPAP